MASIGGVVGIRDRLAYCATKFAVVGLTKAMALDHAADGVRINCVCPGRVETPFVAARLKEYPDPAEAYQQMASTQALGRMGKPGRDCRGSAVSRQRRSGIRDRERAHHRWRLECGQVGVKSAFAKRGTASGCLRCRGSLILVVRAPVAQLDRAPDFESVGRRFESCRARHPPGGRVRPGRAQARRAALAPRERARVLGTARHLRTWHFPLRTRVGP